MGVYGNEALQNSVRQTVVQKDDGIVKGLLKVQQIHFYSLSQLVC